MGEKSSDTIAAIATALGKGGVGVVRVSGPDALHIAKSITGKDLLPRVATYVAFKDEHHNLIDAGIALYFKGPNSFTGEDVLELQGHGGPIVLNMLLNATYSYGARPATAGEFSMRAFINDKLDLTQAEAVSDLINAESKQAALCAIGSLQGTFSNFVKSAQEKLTNARVQVEANIDFSDEDIELANNAALIADIASVKEQVETLLLEAEQGALLATGVKAVIAGEPNAGKSSTLNWLAKDDVAIVTDVAGTTRDVLRYKVDIDGVVLELIDTAGLRATTDVIEVEGIKRAQKEISMAQMLIVVVDGSLESASKYLNDEFYQSSEFKKQYGDVSDAAKVLVVINKIDLLGEKPRVDINATTGIAKVYVSAKKGEGLCEIKSAIKTLIGFNPLATSTFSARKRHVFALEKSVAAICASLELITTSQPVELVAEELRLAQYYLSELTGEQSSDDLLGEIFSTFCIGK